MHLTPRLLLGAALLLPLSAHGQTVSADSAQAIQGQMHGWIAGMLGPAANPDLLTPKVTAADDHYNLSLAIPGLVGDDTATARLKPLDGGRWDLDAIQLPPSMHFNARLPGPHGEPDGMTAFSISIGGQKSHALIDPALRSRSAVDVHLHDVTIRSDGPQQHQLQAMRDYHVAATLQPGQNNLLDFAETASISGWSSTAQIQGKPGVDFAADRISGTGQVVGLDRNQADMLLSAFSGLVATLPPKGAPPPPGAPVTPAERSALQQLVRGLRGIFTSLHAQETIQGLHVTVAGMGEASVRQLRMEMGGAAPNGLMHTWLDLSLDGLAVTGLPPQTAELMPRHVQLRPSLAGVPAGALLDLALRATQPDADQAQLQAEATRLLTTPGARLALEQIGFNVGPAVVQGSGSVTATGPGEYKGDAMLTATGLDALMQQAQHDPMLQQAVPVLAMLRGFAKPEGTRLVWHVVAEGGGVSVNGIPLIQPNQHVRDPQAMPPGHP